MPQNTNELINFNEKEVKEYLDKCIIFWRNKKYRARTKNNNKSSFKSLESIEELKASCYIDAFQSVRISLFGELKL